MNKKFHIKTNIDMIALGEAIGKMSFPNMVITMEGDLGAGKTTMTKGIGQALNVSQIINSPTFTIMKIYDGKLTLYHMDVYRITNDSGDDYLEEYFYAGGVCVVEWARNISEILPSDRLEILIEITPDGSNERIVTLQTDSLSYDPIIAGVSI